MQVKEITSYVLFEVGEIVYHKATGLRGIIVSFNIDLRDVTYNVAWSPFEKSSCYAIELSKTLPEELLQDDEI